MSCDKCCNNCKCCNKCSKAMKLCPLSAGLGLGLTAALATLAWVFWMMYAGPTPMMIQMNIPMPTMQEGLMRALMMFIKGFAFGAVFALIYDMVACCCRCKCCRKSASCNGNCACHTNGNVNNVNNVDMKR